MATHTLKYDDDADQYRSDVYVMFKTQDGQWRLIDTDNNIIDEGLYRNDIAEAHNLELTY